MLISMGDAKKMAKKFGGYISGKFSIEVHDSEVAQAL